MWELDCEESWVLKNWCFWTVVLEKTLESPLDCKEIQPVHAKGNQSWVFFGRTDAKAETPILWPPYVKSWLIGKDWYWEGLGAGGERDDRGWDGWMVSLSRWMWVEWTLGVGDGQGGLVCCDSWGCKESGTTERLNWTELAWNVPLVSLIFLKRSLGFPILLFSSISFHWSWGRLSYLSLLFSGTLHSNGYIFLFLLCFLLLFLSQLFLRPPQTAILLFCISFSWGDTNWERKCRKLLRCWKYFYLDLGGNYVDESM